LRAYGFCETLLDVLCDFLKNRTQQVVLYDGVSEFHDIISGVPQGSVLGPLLFLICINDIVDLFLDNSVQIKLYADDLKVYLEITCDLDNVTLQNCVNNIVEWSEVWQLKLAIDKCQYSHISLSTSSAPAVYFVSDSQLPTTTLCLKKTTMTFYAITSMHIN